MDLKDKRALITGGTSGMGIATALAMAEKGAAVIITGRDETRGASTVEEIRAAGHDAEFIAADFSEMSEVGRVADAAGEIDVLVNLAGVAAMERPLTPTRRRSTVCSTSTSRRRSSSSPRSPRRSVNAHRKRQHLTVGL